MRISKDKNFRRFLFSFALILCIPFVITIFLHAYAAAIIERNVIESNIFKLNNFRDIMDSRIRLIDRSVIELSFNDRLNRVANLPISDYNSPNMFWFIEFHQIFNRFFFHNISSDRAFLFLHYNNVVYGNNFLDFDLHFFYDEFFSFGDTSFEEFKELIFGRRYFAEFMSAEYVTFMGKSGLYLPYFFSLPVVSGASREDNASAWGTMLYLLNVNEIHDLIENSLSELGGETYILSGERVLVSTDSFAGEFLDLGVSLIKTTGQEGVFEILQNEKRNLAIFSHSAQSELTFLTLLPISAIHNDINRFRNIGLALFAAALALGFVVSTVLSYRNTLPIMRIITSNNDLQERLKEQRQLMETLYIDKLLKNDFTSVKNMELSLKHVGLEFNEGSYRVILMRFYKQGYILSDSILAAWDVYRAFFVSLITKQNIVHILSNNELAIIASFKNENDIDPTIRHIQEEFNKQFGFMPFCGIGEAYDSPAQIHRSLQEAQAAADYADTLEESGQIIRYHNLAINDTFELFGKEQEQKLYNLVRLGDDKALESHLENLYRSALYQGLSYRTKQMFLSFLHTVLIRLSTDAKIGGEYIDYKELEKQSGEKQSNYFLSLKNEYVKLCALVAKNKKGRKEKLKENTLNYINERFCDSMLSVATLASHFNVAENYFSQFFSEQVGEPFSRYLERIRIAHACKLLCDPSVSVDKIAMLSGYNNSNTFRRAFKRITGTTPTKYIIHKED